MLCCNDISWPSEGANADLKQTERAALFLNLCSISPQGYRFPRGAGVCEICSRLVFQNTDPLRPPLVALPGKKREDETNWCWRPFKSMFLIWYSPPLSHIQALITLLCLYVMVWYEQNKMKVRHFLLLSFKMFCNVMLLYPLTFTSAFCMWLTTGSFANNSSSGNSPYAGGGSRIWPLQKYRCLFLYVLIRSNVLPGRAVQT